MTTVDARLARLETMIADVGSDVTELKVETIRTRDRLHSLESTAAAFVQTQRDNRRQEERQYQRLGNLVGMGGLLVGLGLLVLSAITLVIHVG